MTENALDKQTTESINSSLFKERKFLLLWIATIFSTFSMSLFMFSQAWYVVRVLGLEAAISLIFIATSVPRIVFMFVGGIAADRISRSKIMFFSDLARSLIAIGLVLLLLSSHEVGIWVFVGFALLFGVFGAFFDPARDSLIPVIVSESQFTRANSIIETTTHLCRIIGPAVAGVVIVWGGYSFVFAVTGFCLFAGAFFIFFVKAPLLNKEGDADQKWIRSIVEGIQKVKQFSLLTAVLLLSLAINIFVAGPLIMGVPLFVNGVLQGSTLDYSLIEGTFAFGLVAGSFALGVINLRTKRGKTGMISLGGLSIGLFLLSLTVSVWQAAVVIFLIGVSMQWTNIPMISAIQSVVEGKIIGRVMSLLSIATLGLTPISYAITSVILSFGVGIRTIMMASAVFLFLLVVFIYWKVPVIRKVD